MRLKLSKIAVGTLFSVSLFSCNIFDKEPLDMISDNVVWNDKNLLDSYIIGVYSQMDFIAHDGKSNGTFWVNANSCLSDEAKDCYTHPVTTVYKPGVSDNTQNPYNIWCYNIIRDINVFLQKIKESDISEEDKNIYLGRMYFARAFCYFAMVKIFGGVPIIKEVQNINDTYEELYPKRDKEEAVYSFIISDIKESIKYLPEKVYDSGWPTKYSALALQSRAALYAGSIARYGKVEKGGVVGIPSDKAETFYRLSIEASREIIASKKFSLYNKESDKAENYRKLFLDEKENPEVIFSKQFTGLNGVSHDWDAFEFPSQFSGTASSGVTGVYLEMIDSYENIDGTTIKLEDIDLNKSWNLQSELFKDKDPRFHASLFFEGTEWQGEKLENWSGLIKNDGTIIDKGTFNKISAVGINLSKSKKNNASITGFGVKKYCDENMIAPKAKTSSTDYIIFRYGEILLNYAEALLELDELGFAIEGINSRTDALSYINDIRKRAGIKLLNDSDLDIDRLRNERKVELAFEGHRYWDLKRWRIAVNAISRSFTGIKTYYDSREPGKFRIEIIKDIDSKPNVFREKNYYFPITPERIQNNKNLVENPGWE